jgi:hypothetical protein
MYILMYRAHNVGQNGTIQIGNKLFDTVEQFKYFGTTITYLNSIHEEIKSRLKSGNACYLWVHTLLSSGLLPRSEKIKIYRTIILPLVLCGCETWSLTLRAECRLRVFENRVLRRILRPKRDEVTGDWRRLQNKELYVLKFSSNIIRVIKLRRLRWAEHVARLGERKVAYRALVGKPEGRRQLGRPSSKWEDNIKMDL